MLLVFIAIYNHRTYFTFTQSKITKSCSLPESDAIILFNESYNVAKSFVQEEKQRHVPLQFLRLAQSN